ncbi:hypothetical protein DYY67_1127 [Candidatus Nitrosotalea sp. TS]|nr:hypothetical protein [Candidatus Nitrosotalea sp. TS]
MKTLRPSNVNSFHNLTSAGNTWKHGKFVIFVEISMQSNYAL